MRRLRSPFALAVILGMAGLAAAIVAFVFADALADVRSPLHPVGPPASAAPRVGWSVPGLTGQTVAGGSRSGRQSVDHALLTWGS